MFASVLLKLLLARPARQKGIRDEAEPTLSWGGAVTGSALCALGDIILAFLCAGGVDRPEVLVITAKHCYLTVPVFVSPPREV